MKNIHYAIMAAIVALTYSVLLFTGTIPEVKGITLFSNSEETMFGLPKYIPITFSIPKIIDVACVFLSLFFLALIVRRIIFLRKFIKNAEAAEKEARVFRQDRKYDSSGNNIAGIIFLILPFLFLFDHFGIGTMVASGIAFGALVSFAGGISGMEKSSENIEECDMEIFLTSSLLFIVLISFNSNPFFGLTAGLILGALTFFLASITSFIGRVLYRAISTFD